MKLCSFLAWQPSWYFPTKWEQVVGYEWQRDLPLEHDGRNSEVVETAYNFKGNSVNRANFSKSWCTCAPVFASVRLQSIFFFLANGFDYLPYLN